MSFNSEKNITVGSKNIHHNAPTEIKSKAQIAIPYSNNKKKKFCLLKTASARRTNIIFV